MRRTLSILFVALSIVCLAQKKEVKLKVVQYTPYCGGAKPPQAMLDAANTPQPYANMTLIYKNAKGKVDSVRTNDSGMVTLNLAYSTYRFYEAWRYHKTLPDPSLKNNYDKKCMDGEWSKTIIKISVSKESQNKVHTAEIHHLCPHQEPCAIKKYFPE